MGKRLRNIMFNIPLQLKFDIVSVSFNQFTQKIPSLTLNGVITGDLNKLNFSVDASSLKGPLQMAEIFKCPCVLLQNVTASRRLIA